MTATDLRSPPVRAAEAAVADFVEPNVSLSKFGLDVYYDDHWVSFATRDANLLRRFAPRSPVGALIESSKLDGSIRWCLDGGAIQLRADAPLKNVPDDRVVAAIDRTALGIEQVVSEKTAQKANRSNLDGEFDSVLETLASEFGWSASAQNGNTTVFELAPDGVGGHARMERLEDCCRLSASVLRECPSFGTFNCDAAATFLLHCSRRVRGCRATAIEGGFLGFDVRVAPDVTDVELHHALSSLSVAVAMSRAEVRTFINSEELSRAYVSSTYAFP